ncbi:MAG: hypothetical protein ACRDT4_15890 [Micromonosporaceae bacterium]
MVSNQPSDAPTEHVGLSLGERLRALDGYEPIADEGDPTETRPLPVAPPTQRPPADPWGDNTADFSRVDTATRAALADDSGAPDRHTDGDATHGLDAMLGTEDATDGPTPEERAGSRRTAVVLSLVLVAALAGLGTGYAVVQAMGGWDAVWVGSDGGTGDTDGGTGTGNEPGGELGQGDASASPGASGSPSPSAAPSVTLTPIAPPSSSQPPDPTPRPSGPGTTAPPTTSSPAPSPSEPSPSRTKPHDD